MSSSKSIRVKTYESFENLTDLRKMLSKEGINFASMMFMHGNDEISVHLYEGITKLAEILNPDEIIYEDRNNTIYPHRHSFKVSGYEFHQIYCDGELFETDKKFISEYNSKVKDA